MKQERKEFRGKRGTATFIDVPPDLIGLVAGWLVYSPHYSAQWQHFYISAIHTRPIPGAAPKYLLDTRVTHEFLVVPLNPHKNPTPKFPKNFAPVMPEIYRVQVINLSDFDAQIICEMLAKASADGVLPLLHGYGKIWHAYVAETANNLDRGEKFVPIELFKGVG